MLDRGGHRAFPSSVRFRHRKKKGSNKVKESMKMRYASLLAGLLVMALTSSAYAVQEKAVFWASNPVSPGETAMVVGAGLERHEAGRVGAAWRWSGG